MLRYTVSCPYAAPCEVGTEARRRTVQGTAKRQRQESVGGDGTLVVIVIIERKIDDTAEELTENTEHEPVRDVLGLVQPLG